MVKLKIVLHLSMDCLLNPSVEFPLIGQCVIAQDSASSEVSIGFLTGWTLVGFADLSCLCHAFDLRRPPSAPGSASLQRFHSIGAEIQGLSHSTVHEHRLSVGQHF
jgi:hypothetical protein